jgi:hypothetical protein
VFYVLVAVAFGVVAGVKAPGPDRRMVVTSGLLVVGGYVLALGLGLTLRGSGALAGFYGGSLLALMGFAGFLACAIAVVRQHRRRRPFDGT